MASSSTSIYDVLDASRNEIRLLSIDSEPGERPMRVSLETHSLDEPRLDMYAISYVWGVSQTPEKVVVNGSVDFPISEGLMDALNELDNQHLFKKRLWIDAICIDQTNNTEKASQVRMMSRIYKEAIGVVMCLGPAGDDSSLVLQLLLAMSQDINQNGRLEQQLLPGVYLDSWLADACYGEIAAQFSSDDIFSHFEGLFRDRPYWTRVWTFQELSFSRFGPFGCFLCGGELLPYNAVLTIMTWKATRMNAKSYFGRMHPRIAKFVGRVVAGDDPPTIQLPNVQGPPWNVAKEYLPLMFQQSAAGRLATDPRDKLFALAAMVDLGVDINYDRAIPDVYLEFALKQLKSIDNLSLLLEYAGFTRRSPELNLASWVPDWAFVANEGLGVWRGVTHGNAYCANKGLQGAVEVDASGSVLRLVGGICGTIQDVMDFPSDASDTPEERDTRALRFLFNSSIATAVEGLTSRRYKIDIPMFQAVFRTYCQGKHAQDRKSLLSISNPTFEDEAAAFVRVLADRKEFESTHFPASKTAKHTSSLRRAVEGLPVKNDTTPNSMLEVFKGKRSYSWESILALVNRNPQEKFDMETSKGIMFGQSPFSRYKLHPLRTRQGHLGFSRASVQAGDIVCVTAASSMPMVLRAQGNHYLFVSNCFLLGYMEGEARAQFRSGSLKPRAFEIL